MFSIVPVNLPKKSTGISLTTSTTVLNNFNSSALKHYGDAESNCNEAKELNEKAQQNSDTGNELHGQVVESVEKLKALVENLDQLVNKEDGISEKVKKMANISSL